MRDRIVNALGQSIFAIRWLLVPIYLLLYIALGVYIWKYFELVWELFSHMQLLSHEALMLGILQLIDMGMIANLVVMTTIGGYSIFVNEYELENLKDRPRWLNKNFSSGDQKIKLGMSLIGVAMIHFLNAFITAEHMSWDVLGKQLAIFGVVFLGGTIAFCFINLMSHSKSIVKDR